MRNRLVPKRMTLTFIKRAYQQGRINHLVGPIRTPQRRGPTGKLDAEEREGVKGCHPSQPNRGLGCVVCIR